MLISATQGSLSGCLIQRYTARIRLLSAVLQAHLQDSCSTDRSAAATATVLTKLVLAMVMNSPSSPIYFTSREEAVALVSVPLDATLD